MLWRESYRPRVIREPARTQFSDESLPIVGSFNLEASREVEIWWRLFEDEFPGLLVEVLPEALREQAFHLRAPSRQSRIRFDTKALGLVSNLDHGRAFCAIVREGMAELIVIGPPTEEVWDEVCTLWRAIRT